jgi:hypothetical protein
MDVTIWTATETATAIVGASIPVLRVLFKDSLSTRGYNIASRDGDVPLTTVGGTSGRIFKHDVVEPEAAKSDISGWSTISVTKETNEGDKGNTRGIVAERFDIGT